MQDTAEIESQVQEGEFIKWRAVVLGSLLAIVFGVVNGYLSINLGWSFGYGAIAVIIAYSLFNAKNGGSCRRELAYVLIASSSQMGLYQIFGLVLYMIETTDVNFPWWMAPPRDILLSGSLNLTHWIAPILVLMLANLLSMTSGLIIATIIRDELNRSPKMVWPNASVNTSLIDACMTGGGSAKLVSYSAIIGLVVTFTQNLPSLWGFDFTTLDLSGFLPEGAFLIISLSIGFACIGYMINVKSSLSLLGSGLVTYLIVSPYLVSRGMIDYNPDAMAYYNDFMMKYTLSPAIGIMLLGGILLTLFMLIKNTLLKKKDKDEGYEETSYLGFYKVLVQGLLRNKVHLTVLSAIFMVIVAGAWILNPFQPMPRTFSVLFVIYSFFFASIIETVFIAKLQGETGMGMGILSMLIYDTPIFGSDYRGYPGFMVYSFMRPSPWISGGTVSYYKYREQIKVSWLDIIKAKITGWIPTMFISIFVTLIFWKYVGFGTEMMPSMQLIRSKVYVSMLATGDVTSTINPWTFIGGGVIGAILEVFTPVSMMGLGMGLFLPPHYIITMGTGGIIRYITNKRYGESFYKEKGRLIVTGLMASSLIVQVTMTILSNFL
ncbi:MAG: OPT/YSL family transporter [Candidatus Bathyarchaeota archaeon]|nr:OPT/YSL family transporter [Candidatus Bathyarchaeota archaeon]